MVDLVEFPTMFDYQFLFSGFPRLAVVEVRQDTTKRKVQLPKLEVPTIRPMQGDIYPKYDFVRFYMVQYLQFKYLTFAIDITCEPAHLNSQFYCGWKKSMHSRDSPISHLELWEL